MNGYLADRGPFDGMHSTNGGQRKMQYRPGWTRSPPGALFDPRCQDATASLHIHDDNSRPLIRDWAQPESTGLPLARPQTGRCPGTLSERTPSRLVNRMNRMPFGRVGACRPCAAAVFSTIRCDYSFPLPDTISDTIEDYL